MDESTDPVRGAVVEADLAAAAARTGPWRMLATVVLADLAGLALAIAVAYAVRLLAGGHFKADQIAALWPLPVLLLALYAGSRLYAVTPPHPAEELRRMTLATTMAFIILVMATFFLRTGELYSRIATVLAWGIALFSIPLTRMAIRSIASRRRWWGVPLVVLGAGRTADLMVHALRRWPSRGLRPVLLLDDEPGKHGIPIAGIAVSGPIDELLPLAADCGIRHLMVAMPGAPPDRLRRLWRLHGKRFPNVLLVPGLSEFASLWVEAKDLGGNLALELRQSLLLPSRRFLKRLLDLLLVVIGGAVLLPALLGIALAVRATSRGPAFYSQRRLGMGGAEFRAWKFRTMCADADAVLARYLAEDPVLREEWERDHKLRHDPRVTWIGRILRKTSLDELPQLWNVLIGDMSLVGPRPITAAEVPKYGDLWEFYQRVRPGLTGLWQISGRNLTTYDERVAFDAFYVSNWSPWLDLVILARTVQTVLRGEGAY